MATMSARGDTVVCTDCDRARNRRYHKTRDKDKARASAAAWVLNNPMERRAARRKWQFGLTQVAFLAMLESQGGACGLCRTPLTGETFIDHDHACCPGGGSRKCGKCVRAILCRKCNQGLGMFDDDPEALMAAASYVLAYRDVLPGLRAV